VVACTGSCLEEAGGPHSVYLAPDDVAGFVSTVRELQADEPRRQQMIAAGRTYVERFSDDALGRNLMTVYQKVMAP
jgi:glycosyltransferase involved in cell wall biosynthesis